MWGTNFFVIVCASTVIVNKIGHIPGPHGPKWRIFAKNELRNDEVVRNRGKRD
jgi:hypothetical protein